LWVIGVFEMVVYPSIDWAVVRDRGVENAIGCRHIQSIDGRWGSRMKSRVGVRLLLYVPNAYLDRLKRPIETRAEILKIIRGELP
jgi:hypothetical protein